MKTTNAIACVLACALLAACETPKVTQEEMQAVNFGPAPEHWKQEITSYLKLRLRDPDNAVIDFLTEPKKMYQKQVGLDPQHHGWAVCVVVRDKDRGGAWREPYPMTVFIRNEKIVHVNNGPDDFGPIGPAYARRQCKELGAKDLP
ncbi:MAG TPA: hypothetical protein VK043_14515 [Burkholderiales bacterium]|nr:hypothetical protein [Burkholderiales bacterium]